MSREVRRYSFQTSVPSGEIENTLHLAVLAAEGLHGQSRVRLDATYCFDAEKHACVIDAGSDVGRDICRMFTGFAIREFGDEAFSVSRPDSIPDAETTRRIRPASTSQSGETRTGRVAAVGGQPADE